MILPIMFVTEVKQLLKRFKKSIKIFSQSKKKRLSLHKIIKILSLLKNQLVDVEIWMVHHQSLLYKYLINAKMSQMQIPSTSWYMYNYIIIFI